MNIEVRMKNQVSNFKGVLLSVTDGYFIVLHKGEVRHFDKHHFKCIAVVKRKAKGVKA
jgi:hypothetical protein